MQTRAASAVSILFFTFLLTASALLATNAYAQQGAEDPSVTVQMKNAKGESVGTVEVKQLAQGVLLVADLENLPRGPHGFHIHKKAKCKPPDFKSAGGHYSPLDNKQGHHAGDLPNIHVTGQGTAETEIFVHRLILGMSSTANQDEVAEAGWEEGPFPLLDENGSAIIIHKKPDDYEAMPPGSTGPRIACGVIQSKRPETIGN